MGRGGTEAASRGARNGATAARAGYTLAELVVAMSLSVIAATMSLQGLSYVTKSLSVVDKGSLANDEATLLNEYLGTLMMSTGGGNIRPWAAVWVEDNFNGDGTDRVTFAELANIDLQCSIARVDRNRVMLDDSDGCCLSENFLHRRVIMMTGNNDSHAHWEARVITGVDLDHCSVVTQLDRRARILNFPPSRSDSWADGPLSVVNIRTIWVDTRTHEMKVAEDYDHDGQVEVRIVADRVFDFQVALGYDVPPWDWKVTDTGGADDEWLYNAPDDAWDEGGLEGVRRTDLRLIQFGVTVGAPSTSSADEGYSKLLNGPPRYQEGWVFRSSLGTTSMRNHDIMR